MDYGPTFGFVPGLGGKPMPQRRKGLCLSPGCLRELQKHSKIAKKSGDPETFVRIRGIVLVSEGYNYRKVGQFLDVTSGSVSNWVARYLDGGPRALATETRSGRPRKLSEEELCEFEEIIDAGAMAYGFPNELWDAKRAARIILECFAVSYHPNHVAKILHQRGFSVQRPAVTLAKANREAQKNWENEDIPRIARRAKKNGRASFSKTKSV
jgi:transposase